MLCTVGYHVELRDMYRGLWLPVSRTSPEQCSVRVHNLIEGNRYFFRVLAENRAGMSDALEKTTATTPKRPKGWLLFKGYGKFRPIATNKTDEGRQENRRVEFEVIDN